MSALEITWEERDVLRKELASDVSCALADLRFSAEIGRVDKAGESGLRHRADAGMWLLDDLGWGLVDARESYYLTLPADRLAGWLRWMRDQTEWCLRDRAKDLTDSDLWDSYIREGHMTVAEVERTIVEDRETCDNDLDVLRVCDDLLARLEAS